MALVLSRSITPQDYTTYIAFTKCSIESPELSLGLKQTRPESLNFSLYIIRMKLIFSSTSPWIHHQIPSKHQRIPQLTTLRNI